MVGHGGSSAGSYLADPTSPIPFHCASIVATSTLRVKLLVYAELFSVIPKHEVSYVELLYNHSTFSTKCDFQIEIIVNTILCGVGSNQV